MSSQVPTHITKIVPNDILRIAMRAGKHLEMLRQDGHPTLAVPEKSRGARGYSKTVFLCVVLDNNVPETTLTVDFQDSGNSQIHYIAKFKYSDILNAQLYFAGALPMVDPTPKTHPGSQGLGTKSFAVYQLESAKYVNVIF